MHETIYEIFATGFVNLIIYAKTTCLQFEYIKSFRYFFEFVYF